MDIKKKGFARHNSKYGFAHLVLLILLSVAIVAGIGYYAYKTGQVKIIQQKQSTPSTPSLDETANLALNGDLANWKTYTNTVYNFSFEYPPTDTISIHVCVKDFI